MVYDLVVRDEMIDATDSGRSWLVFMPPRLPLVCRQIYNETNLMPIFRITLIVTETPDFARLIRIVRHYRQHMSIVRTIRFDGGVYNYSLYQYSRFVSKLFPALEVVEFPTSFHRKGDLAAKMRQCFGKQTLVVQRYKGKTETWS